jgi:hypothetical protein
MHLSGSCWTAEALIYLSPYGQHITQCVTYWYPLLLSCLCSDCRLRPAVISLHIQNQVPLPALAARWAKVKWLLTDRANKYPSLI